MSSDDVLLGLGLVLVLAVAAQLTARRLGLPAIVVLLPVGFVAGILTDDVHPDALLGQLYQPFVSLAVGVVLFEAALRLSFREVAAELRAVVTRLVAAGVLVTGVGVALAASLLFDGLGSGLPWLLGAVLVVSGPTVVLPLLASVRPTREVRAVLTWEGVLVDPVGALLGVLVFHVVLAHGASGWHPGEMLSSVVVGAAVGGAGALVLHGLLPEVERTAPRQAVPATLMVIVAALVAADLLRDDAGFVATTTMGMILANQRRVDVSLTLEFQTTLVQLLVGVLFVLIAASVSPSDIGDVLGPALALVAVMVLVLRPLAVALATARSVLAPRERAFAAWMAPRGIVAGATASAFGLALQQQGIAGAQQLLPIVFVVIFATVVLYGLTARPVARALGVADSSGSAVLIVGGHAPARAIGAALVSAGVPVRLWAGDPHDQAAAREAGLPVERGRLMVDALSRETEVDAITDALLLTRSDDFNALAAQELGADLGRGHVFRVAPDPERPDLLPPMPDRGILGGTGLTLDELERRLRAGARLAVVPAGGGAAGPALFSIADGRLEVAADGHAPATAPGAAAVVLLGPRSPDADDADRAHADDDRPATATTRGSR